MRKMFETDVDAADTKAWQITGEGCTVYAYAADAFSLSVYGYNVLSGQAELIVTAASNAHDEVRVNLVRSEDGTIMYQLVLHGDEDNADLPMIADLAGGRYSKVGVVPTEDVTLQVWE